ncbi:E3 ubiquitin-protein ligase HACE1 [Striga asiatica]|uniref:E3 ubiquitin-protein ligase HACE1 n=1 Tax=Striga asiatica TaxID=4170 RepID=A0A5A7PXI5_STRAF|nr:E3 ubiquitin-protein ligase HACE1 [Striga asiatica]
MELARRHLDLVGVVSFKYSLEEHYQRWGRVKGVGVHAQALASQDGEVPTQAQRGNPGAIHELVECPLHLDLEQAVHVSQPATRAHAQRTEEGIHSGRPDATVVARSVHELDVEVGGGEDGKPSLVRGLGQVEGHREARPGVGQDDVERAGVEVVGVCGEVPFADAPGGRPDAVLDAGLQRLIVHVEDRDLSGGAREEEEEEETGEGDEILRSVQHLLHYFCCDLYDKREMYRYAAIGRERLSAFISQH